MSFKISIWSLYTLFTLLPGPHHFSTGQRRTYTLLRFRLKYYFRKAIVRSGTNNMNQCPAPPWEAPFPTLIENNHSSIRRRLGEGAAHLHLFFYPLCLFCYLFVLSDFRPSKRGGLMFDVGEKLCLSLLQLVSKILKLLLLTEKPALLAKSCFK